MPNQNTRSYLEAIKIKVLEHLRLLSTAPAVQMQEMAPDMMGVVDDVLLEDLDRELVNKGWGGLSEV